MAKVLLVEDDNNLREIFEMRLQAEGYETLSASDGEEALVVATAEKPDLIIADVMMPKLSGFEMLETLRTAPEVANAKVIMMTALGQAEDRARGEKLGVVKYLVKSQVTLEDFVRVVREVLPLDEQAKVSTDTTGAKKDQGSRSINNQESEKPMQDNNNPTMPPADDAAPSNPITGGDSSVPPAPADGSAAMPPTEPAPMGDSGSSSGGDSGFPVAEPPVPPADSPQPPAEEPKPNEGPTSTPPAGM